MEINKLSYYWYHKIQDSKSQGIDPCMRDQNPSTIAMKERAADSSIFDGLFSFLSNIFDSLSQFFSKAFSSNKPTVVPEVKKNPTHQFPLFFEHKSYQCKFTAVTNENSIKVEISPAIDDSKKNQLYKSISLFLKTFAKEQFPSVNSINIALQLNSSYQFTLNL